MTGDDVIDVILGRRSVRFGYNGRPIARPTLERIVQCGLGAPSSKGATPWRFTVVTDTNRLGELAAMVRTAPQGDSYVPHDPTTGRRRPDLGSTVDESADVLAGASAAVFIVNAGPFSGGRRALLDADPDARELAVTGYELELAGLGAALENMWLAAVASGLAAAFLGDVGVAEAEICRDLSLDGDLLGSLVLGYSPAEAGPRRDPRLPSSLVRWDPPPPAG